MPERVGFPCAHALGTLLLKSNTNLGIYSILCYENQRTVLIPKYEMALVSSVLKVSLSGGPLCLSLLI